MNDVISYITTAPTEKSSDSAAKRAYAPNEVLPSTSTLKPDVDWYLIKQIFPPIERLCAPITGTDPIRLAECLGLDTRKYSIGSTSHNSAQPQEITPLESQIPDSERFKDCARLTLRCRYCTHSFVFEGLATSLDICTPNGIVCPADNCKRLFLTITLVAQLEHAIRMATSSYYDNYLVCDDASCGNRTRQTSVYGHRCLGPKGLAQGCLGRMRKEMGEKVLYNQLLYFRKLWDVKKGGEGGKIEGERKERLDAARALNMERFGTCEEVVEGYLKKCGRVTVLMDGLFGFMRND